MIANRLQDLEPELHISPDAPAILNSGRTVYATNCVYCYQDGDSVVCKGEAVPYTHLTLPTTYTV